MKVLGRLNEDRFVSRKRDHETPNEELGEDVILIARDEYTTARFISLLIFILMFLNQLVL
jgi:hypothetical protein